jgi:hypothetical protein
MIAAIRERFYQVINHRLKLCHVVDDPGLGIRPR